MTETRDVSIDEVRALVTERQRYDDWLTALDAKRDETPSRVFERVYGDYVARRRDVLVRLRAHVGGLISVKEELEIRLTALESRLGSLEDERAEAMLRTAVGEYDADRWEQVRQDVESQIADLSEQRVALTGEVDEVRGLLTNAQSGPHDTVEDTNAAEPVADASSDAPSGVSSEEPLVGASFVDHTEIETVEATAEWPATAALATSGAMDGTSHGSSHDTAAPHADVAELTPVDDDPFGLTAGDPARGMPGSDHLADQPIVQADSQGHAHTNAQADAQAVAQAEMDNALAVFSGEASPAYRTTPISTATSGLPTGLDGVDVFDDSDLGDLRMAPPTRATATATPPASPVSGSPTRHPADAGRDGFDDLAFLRSVVDPTAGAGVRGPASGEQQKTLRCTECGTMNFPTEWYCERCGGELAAF